MSLTETEMECPFTWGMDHLVQYFEEDYDDLRIDESEEENIAFMINVVDAFVNVKREKFESAKTSLESAEKNLRNIGISDLSMRRNGISLRVLDHILNASYYHYYKATNSKKNKLPPVIKDVREKCQFNSYIYGRFEVTLNGCKAIAWSIFKDHGCEKAISYAQQVIPNMKADQWPLWQFVLGKNLRERRLQKNLRYEIPTEEEKYHLCMAYQLDPHCVLYGIFVARMYYECNDVKSFEICKDLDYKITYNRDIKQLRCANVFTSINYLLLAKKNLDFLEEYIENLESEIKIHIPYYLGMYYYQTFDFKIAVKHFEKAALLGNAMADLKYVELKILITNYEYRDFIKNFELLLKKYPNNNFIIRQVSLHLAMEYFFHQDKIIDALNYFLKAIKVNPKSKYLRNYQDIFEGNRSYINIYDFLRKDVQDRLANKICSENLVDIKRIINGLEDLYAKYKCDTNNSQKLFNRINI